MVEAAIAELRRQHQELIASALEKLNRREKRLKKLIMFCLIIVALGCAGGIYAVNDISKTRRDTACWAAYHTRLALRALINKSTLSGVGQKDIIKNDPALNLILKESKTSSKKFKTFAFTSLPLPSCHGPNPTKVSPVLLKLGK